MAIAYISCETSTLTGEFAGLHRKSEAEKAETKANKDAQIIRNFEGLGEFQVVDKLNSMLGEVSCLDQEVFVKKWSLDLNRKPRIVRDYFNAKKRAQEVERLGSGLGGGEV